MMKVIKWIKARDLSIEGTKKNFNNKERCFTNVRQRFLSVENSYKS